MKIHTYNQHTRLLSSESWSVSAAKFTRPGEEPTLLSNQLHSSLNMVLSSNVRMWATAISTNTQNGRKIIFRYAKELSASFDHACQPIRIIIVWKYKSEGGQPMSEDHRRMNELEDMLESVLKEDGFATLALVSTGENLREWTCHTKSETEFMARLNYALAGVTAFPIEIHPASDPDWDMYERFKAGIKQS